MLNSFIVGVLAAAVAASVPSDLSTSAESRSLGASGVGLSSAMVANNETAPVCEHGYVDRRDKCVCLEDFITWPEDSTTQCNYEQHKQLTAFLLALFLGVYGAGRFYIGDITAGVLKLLLGLFASCVFPCVAVCCCRASDNSVLIVMKFVIIGLLSLGVSVWWIIDLVLFGTNELSDDAGAQLAPW